MTGFLEERFLEFEGLSEQDIADLTGALPDLQKLIGVLQQEWPTIVKIAPILLRVVEKVIEKQRGLT